MNDAPTLLFISPVIPCPTGNGLAMRQALFLAALAASHQVHLHVVRLFPPPGDSWALARLESSCASVVVQEVEGREDPQFHLIEQIQDERYRMAALASYRQPRLLRYATERTVAEAARLQAGRRFDAVHVGRLYLAPFSQPFRGRAGGREPWTVLDLDDYESAAHRRLAALHAARGEHAVAWLEQAEAEKYERCEEDALPTFHRVCVASEFDRQALAKHMPQVAAVHVPNAVALPPRTGRRSSECFRLLFVGSMGYLPNDDAAFFFISEVLPLLRARSDRPVVLTVVGSFPSPQLCALAQAENVIVTGAVADVAPYYEDTDVVVAPLRAGGGTRIKILEAFGYRCPVVATRLAAEGIDAEHGEHLLLADGAEEFAEACLHLLRDPSFARKSAAKALRLVRRDYSHAVVGARIRTLMRAPGLGPAPPPTSCRIS